MPNLTALELYNLARLSSLDVVLQMAPSLTKLGVFFAQLDSWFPSAIWPNLRSLNLELLTPGDYGSVSEREPAFQAASDRFRHFFPNAVIEVCENSDNDSDSDADSEE